MDLRDRFRGCLLGLASGDAVGMSVEHRKRGTFAPLTGMVGGGPFDRPAGHWTDDTAMAICLAESLLETGGFDALDQMTRYTRWARGEYLGETGTNLDIGGTVAEAIYEFLETGEPNAGSTDPEAAGNGCIMRLAPIPMFFAHDLSVVEARAAESALITHGATECVDACRLLARIIWRALQGEPKDTVAFGDIRGFSATSRILAIARGEYRDKSQESIRGSGYVVESLEAALWCFASTDTFEEAVLAAANLGDDADTTAAICGQVAGAYYGVTGIPAEWLRMVAMKSEIGDIADRLLVASEGRTSDHPPDEDA